ncbi:MAG: PAS domain S-box protein [Deltaproteobacteria bacterium]|nr:PAS domain S-box protein [Deltaproteobacteria bacterium]
MNLQSLANQAQQTINIEQNLRFRLLWMLLLRVILYTLLLGISVIFQSEQFDVILLPSNVLSLLLLPIYLITIFFAFFLLIFQGDLRKFGIMQVLLDTFFVTTLVFFSGSSNSVFTSVYFFPIISAGLILPRKGGLIAATAASLQYGSLLAMEMYGLYPHYIEEFIFFAPNPPPVILNHFSIHGITFFLAAVLSTIFGTRLRKTEDALSVSIKKYDHLTVLYKQIFDNITTGILTVDNQNIITSANNAIETITGRPSDTLTGETINSLFKNFDLTTPNSRFTTDFIRSDGKQIRVGYTHIIMEHAGETVSSEESPQKIITLRDISDIEKLEKQVRQTEKLAAIGMMSASIAHDFRNPLAAISGSAQILASEFAIDGKSNQTNGKLTDIILRESDRLTDTIADFLKFSRPEHANRQWFSLYSCLEEVLQVCRADPAYPKTCKISMVIEKALDIWADGSQMFTVFMHLIQNGLAFCPEGNEQITIIGNEISRKNGEEWVEISVSDNGPGIPEDQRKEQIFEPFFTSRADGTGLGLAIVKQTVSAHQGTIKVEEADTGGTRCVLNLPLPPQPE